MPTRGFEEIETHLGRDLRPEDRGAITDLNAVPPALVDEARRLPPRYRRLFLRYHVHHDAWPFVAAFAVEVIDGDVAPRDWLRGGILVPSFGLGDLLERDAATLLAPLDLERRDGWFRVRPDHVAWSRNDRLRGAPALLRPDLTYRWSEPPRVLRQVPAPPLDPASDPVIALRRWIAAQVARAAALRHALDAIRSVDRLSALGILRPERLSRDSAIAVRALATEENHFGPSIDTVPGFRGPDAWYAGHLPAP